MPSSISVRNGRTLHSCWCCGTPLKKKIIHYHLCKGKFGTNLDSIIMSNDKSETTHNIVQMGTRSRRPRLKRKHLGSHTTCNSDAWYSLYSPNTSRIRTILGLLPLRNFPNRDKIRHLSNQNGYRRLEARGWRGPRRRSFSALFSSGPASLNSDTLREHMKRIFYATFMCF